MGVLGRSPIFPVRTDNEAKFSKFSVVGMGATLGGVSRKLRFRLEPIYLKLKSVPQQACSDKFPNHSCVITKQLTLGVYRNP